MVFHSMSRKIGTVKIAPADDLLLQAQVRSLPLSLFLLNNVLTLLCLNEFIAGLPDNISEISYPGLRREIFDRRLLCCKIH